MDEVSPLEKWKPWTIEAAFSKSKTKKEIQFDFHVKFYKPVTNN